MRRHDMKSVSRYIALLMCSSLVLSSVDIPKLSVVYAEEAQEESQEIQQEVAQETPQEIPQEESSQNLAVEEISYTVSEDEWIDTSEFAEDNKELQELYLATQLGLIPGISAYSLTNAREQLDINSQKVYDNLKPEIEKIAAGERASASIEISMISILGKNSFISEELGEIDINNAETNDLANAFYSKCIDSSAVLYALLADCSYELYWFDKTRGVKQNIAFSGYRTTNETTGQPEFVLSEEAGIIFHFSVDPLYAGTEDYQTDTAKTSVAKNTVANVSTILQTAAAMSDYEKLKYYKEQICNLTEYNSEAANAGGVADYGTIAPWQLVYVFDNDPSTKVVCEGYAKAFAYLCELTEFASTEIMAYTVAGWMNSGAHMWNVVHMEDGKNYLVDVTNCDTGTVGAPDYLFMRGYSQEIQSGSSYIINVKNPNGSDYDIYYEYGGSTLEVYTEDELKLADSNYPRPEDNNPSANATKKCFVGEVDIKQQLQNSNGEDWYWPGSTSTSYLKASISANGVVELTFCNFTLESNYTIRQVNYSSEDLIYADGDLKLNLLGENQVLLKEDTEESVYYRNHGICIINGNLEITGQGKENSSLYMRIINEKTISVEPHNNTSVKCNIKITDAALAFSQDNSKAVDTIIYAKDKITVENSCISMNNFFAEDVHSSSYGIYCKELDSENSEFDITVEDNPEIDRDMGCGISCFYMDMNETKVSLLCKTDTYSSFGGVAFVETHSFRGNTIEMEMQNNNGTSFGGEEGTLQDSTFIIADGVSTSSGITGSKLTMENCIVHSKKDAEGNVVGYLSISGSDNLVLRDCEIDVYGKISSQDAMTLERCNINILCGTDAIITNTGYIHITGGSIHAVSEMTQAIGANEITITGGEHYFEGTTYSIYTKNGDTQDLKASYIQSGGKVTAVTHGEGDGGRSGSVLYGEGPVILKNNGELSLTMQKGYEMAGIRAEGAKVTVESGILIIDSLNDGIIAETFHMKDGTVTVKTKSEDYYRIPTYGIKVDDFQMDAGTLTVNGDGDKGIGIYTNVDLTDRKNYYGHILFGEGVIVKASGNKAAVAAQRMIPVADSEALTQDITKALICEDTEHCGYILRECHEEEIVYWVSGDNIPVDYYIYIDTFADTANSALNYYTHDMWYGGAASIELPTEKIEQVIPPEEKIAEITDLSLTVLEDGNIGLNYYIVCKNDELGNLSFKIEKNGKTEEGTLLEKGIQDPYYYADEEARYRLSVNVAAAQMTDVITLTVYKGEEEIDTASNSVMDYAKKFFDEYGEDSNYRYYVTKVRNMLNYGARAQQYFEYHTETLANDILDTEQRVLQAYPQDAFAYCETEGFVPHNNAYPIGEITYYGSSLVMDSHILLRHYFMIDEEDVSQYAFYAGSELELHHKAGNLYYVEFNPGISNNSELYVSKVNDPTNFYLLRYGIMTYASKTKNLVGREVLNELLLASYWYMQVG